MDIDQNRIRPKWKMNKADDEQMEDDNNERQQNGRQLKQKTTNHTGAERVHTFF